MLTRSARPVVLVFVKYYVPGYKSGGPVRAIANMIEHLSPEVEFRVVTNDRDAGDAHSYRGVAVDSWSRVGKADVYYLSPRHRNIWSMAKLLRDTPHDVLYCNSYFDPHFTVLPLLARRLRMSPYRPAVVAPRGEFSPEALSLKKVRKTIFIRLAKLMGIYRDVLWHASTEEEEGDLRARLGNVSVEVAADLPPVHMGDSEVAGECQRQASDSSLKVVFLSRVAPMKNLRFVAKVLSRISAQVECDVFGVISDLEYWNSVRRILAELPPNVTVTYKGPVPHEEVHETLSRYDLFFLPTLGESYGHAIREALEAGTPVLISDRTPWRDLEREGIGWDLPLDSEDRFVEAIEGMADMPREKRSRQRSACRKYAEDVRAESSSIDRHKLIFSKAAYKER